MPSVVQQVLLGFGIRPDASITFLQSNTSTTDLTTYTFSSENLGAADSGRYIIVALIGHRTTAVACSLSTLTVGGVSATIIKQSGTTQYATALAIALVPTGTTGDIVATWNGTCSRMGLSVYRALNVNPTPEADGLSTANPQTSTLSVSAGSVQVAIGSSTLTSTATWSGTNGLTEDMDAAVSDGGRFSTASRTSPTALSVTGTVTFTASANPAYVSASFAKA